MIVFLTVGALTLVAISEDGGGKRGGGGGGGGEGGDCGTEAYLRLTLEYVYSQITFTLTDQVQTIFRRSPGFDIRSMLGATDSIIRSILDRAGPGGSGGGAYLSAGVETICPMPHTVRHNASTVLLDACDKHSDTTLFALLLVGDKLVTLVQPSYRPHHLRPSDLHLIVNFVFRQPDLLTSELWFPVCLPRLNSSGFVYTYTSGLDKLTGLSLILISQQNTTEQFDLFRNLSAKIRAGLGLPPRSSGDVIRISDRRRERKELLKQQVAKAGEGGTDTKTAMPVDSYDDEAWDPSPTPLSMGSDSDNDSDNDSDTIVSRNGVTISEPQVQRDKCLGRHDSTRALVEQAKRRLELSPVPSSEGTEERKKLPAATKSLFGFMGGEAHGGLDKKGSNGGAGGAAGDDDDGRSHHSSPLCELLLNNSRTDELGRLVDRYLEIAGGALHFLFRIEVSVGDSGGGGGRGGRGGGFLNQCLCPALDDKVFDTDASRARVWNNYQRLNLRLRLGSAGAETTMDAFDMIVADQTPSESNAEEDEYNDNYNKRGRGGSERSVVGNGTATPTADQSASGGGGPGVGRDVPAQCLLESPPNVHGVAYVLDGDDLFVGLNGRFFELYAVLPGTVSPRIGTALCTRLVRRLMYDEGQLFLAYPFTWRG